MDALLGAAALGDLGKHFPPTDPKWRGADSVELLKIVYSLVRDSCYTIGNADITIVLESPRLSGFIEAMRSRIADALCTEVGNISVKATTEEKMGFTGDGTGISATAVVILLSSTDRS